MKELEAIAETHVPGLGLIKRGERVKDARWVKKLANNAEFIEVAKKKEAKK